MPGNVPQIRPQRISDLRMWGPNSGGKILFFAPRTASLALLDPAASMVLCMCDGVHTVEELSQIFMPEMGDAAPPTPWGRLSIPCDQPE